MVRPLAKSAPEFDAVVARFQFLGRVMGMALREGRQTAALMGVHTIGKASLENSGYSGWWQDEQNVARFNNNYYISIVNHGWGPAQLSSGKSQWNREDTNHDQGNLHPEMMLNTDMCLAFNNVFAESSNCCTW